MNTIAPCLFIMMSSTILASCDHKAPQNLETKQSISQEKTTVQEPAQTATMKPKKTENFPKGEVLYFDDIIAQHNNDESKAMTALTAILESGNVILDFYATWCGPCKMMDPVVSELAKELKDDTLIIKVNIDNEAAKNIVSHYRVKSIPTFMYFENGDMKNKATGALTKKKLREALGIKK